MNRIPHSLWILPLLFGIIGGVVAALIADLKCKASWWELMVVGVMVSIIWWAIFMALMPVMFQPWR